MIKTILMAAAGLAVALVAGCTDSKNRIAYDGKYFRTKVSKVDGQRDEFVVNVRDVSQSVAGARAAALHAANSYCVGTYGSSDIAWVVGPDTPDAALGLEDNTLSYRGTCPQGR